jgi:hypothetical protein
VFLIKKITGAKVTGSFQKNQFTVGEKLDTVKAIARNRASDANTFRCFCMGKDSIQNSAIRQLMGKFDFAAVIIFIHQVKN